MSKINSICASDGFWQFFAGQGVLDGLVAFVLAANFTKLSSSLADNIITPVVSYTLPQTLQNYYLVMRSGPAGPKYLSADAAVKDGATVLQYGRFISEVISFIVMLFVFYLALRFACRFLSR